MFKLLISTITLVLCVTGWASAADLTSPPVAPLAVPGPGYDWTGFYAGGNIGFGTDRYTFPYGFQGPGVPYFPGRATIVSNGPIGGGQFGYNYQFAWKGVLGIDIEAEDSGVGGNKRIVGPSTWGDISTNVHYYGAFRARFGYAFDRFLIIDNVMVYIAMGGAFGSFSDNTAVAVGPAFVGYNQTTTRFEVSKGVGSLGVGLAHPVTPNLSVFIDYRYTALGPEWAHGRQIDIYEPGGVTAATFGTRCMYHLIRVGANWKFDFGL
jgi:outer membrane immunogenic protein